MSGYKEDNQETKRSYCRRQQCKLEDKGELGDIGTIWRQKSTSRRQKGKLNDREDIWNTKKT
jgi:hypothetical protein